ncbi:MAG TPA: GNAT family N-acetyltransferase [Candidatus Binatia bacterium]|nr:GNAT family N-acetyltransferase [Candidatus Binatia bacterium]
MQEPVEKRFYLEDFRNRAILFHVDDARELDAVAGGVLSDLIDNPTLVLVVARHFSRKQRPVRLRQREVKRDAGALVPVSARLFDDYRVDVQRPRGLFGARALAFSTLLACRLGVSKVVIVDPRGGLEGTHGPRSFVHAASLARLCRSGEDVDDWTAAELGELLSALRQGVEAVNLCTLEGLGEELFTYQGSGTLLTTEEYCSVAPLGVEHFREAERLLTRGEREGFLLERTEEQRLELLLTGYGAWFGGTRLAGVCGLETNDYARQKIGEIVGLYTITRFQGEGVGVRMVEFLIDVARKRKLKGLFAATSSLRAAAFFQRLGFEPSDPDRVPKIKWTGRRGPLPLVFWRDL